MAAFGLDDEISDAPREDEVELEQYEIWPDNVKALNVFLSLATQWDEIVISDISVRRRIHYPSIKTVLGFKRFIKRKEHPEIFEEIRAMEAVARDVFQAEANRKLEVQQTRNSQRP